MVDLPTTSPPSQQPPPPPPPPQYQHKSTYHDDYNHWAQPPMSDSYARCANYEIQGNQYHPSGFSCGYGRYKGDRY